MKEIFKNRETVHQDELIDVLLTELDLPNTQTSLSKKATVSVLGRRTSRAAGDMAGAYGTKLQMEQSLEKDVMDVVQEGKNEAEKIRADEDYALVISKLQAHNMDTGAGDSSLKPAENRGLPPGQPASLKLVRGDIEAFVVTQRHNRDHEVDIKQLIDNVYKPPDEKKVIHYVNDGLNRALRGNPPPRERPADHEVPRYENYWQARYLMEALADAIALVENSNGGKLKPSKMFKRMDFDNDGYLSMSDLRSDNGAVDIGEFTRNYQVHQGSLLDSMMRPIKSVKHEGGVEFGGPIQEKIDAHQQELDERHRTQAARSSSAPPNTGDESGSPASRSLSATLPPATGGSGSGSQRSQMSRTGASIAGRSTPLIYETQVNQLTGKARISDVIRSRFSAWKPDKPDARLERSLRLQGTILKLQMKESFYQGRQL
ncbi:hypothetical protein AK812_SmicGene12170 [Symbiodinium microadriaticum]|uniref:EF-hand domain-containing protein n=1 Tax=Symbiodinium microadriaticum TaxID=2951 RepID=A0A1Q9EBD4_SYMMI|nr:hypothetical protein AK812_SmicGene12170 [Symbiodinium microadriaticum]